MFVLVKKNKKIMLDVVMKQTRKVRHCLHLYILQVTRKLEGHTKRVTLAFSNTLNVLVYSGADAYWKLQYYFQTRRLL